MFVPTKKHIKYFRLQFRSDALAVVFDMNCKRIRGLLAIKSNEFFVPAGIMIPDSVGNNITQYNPEPRSIIVNN